MKKMFLVLSMAISVVSISAQNSYIVKTRSAKKTVVEKSKSQADAQESEEEDKARDFISENFTFYSLCNWQEGMKFMVMPEKYDFVVNTFCDKSTGKEVGNGRMRHKIMIYKGHSEGSDGRARVDFLCQDDNKEYYYPIPNGSFEDYCYNKMGVPTLAYLGDVDIARTKLMGASLYTTTTLYRIDTDVDGDGFEEVKVPKNSEVKVTAVGVGTRSYPVKLIVEDKKGNEFYQNVAISKTNCGMRDDEFIMDNAKFTFAGSFELIDANVAVKGEYAKYINKKVYTKYSTKMTNSKGEKVTVSRLSSFTITGVKPSSSSNYVEMTLKANSGNEFTKQVTFVNDNVAGDIDGFKEDYFGYLFAYGVPSVKGVSAAHMKLIQEGKVAVGFTKAEVKLAKGAANKTASANSGLSNWIYEDGTVVRFGKNGKVISVKKHF